MESHPIEFGFVLLSGDTSAFIMPIVMLQIVIRSVGRPDLCFQPSCWIPVDGDFSLRTAVCCPLEGYYIRKRHDTVRMAFFVDLDHFKRMAWDHDHSNPAPLVDARPYVIRDT